MTDGGNAFPTANEPARGYLDPPRMIPGMSMRDYFAARAMQAFITRGAIGFISDQKGVSVEESWPILSAGAYGVADAMLEARK